MIGRWLELTLAMDGNGKQRKGWQGMDMEEWIWNGWRWVFELSWNTNAISFALWQPEDENRKSVACHKTSKTSVGWTLFHPDIGAEGMSRSVKLRTFDDIWTSGRKRGTSNLPRAATLFICLMAWKTGKAASSWCLCVAVWFFPEHTWHRMQKAFSRNLASAYFFDSMTYALPVLPVLSSVIKDMSALWQCPQGRHDKFTSIIHDWTCCTVNWCQKQNDVEQAVLSLEHVFFSEKSKSLHHSSWFGVCIEISSLL